MLESGYKIRMNVVNVIPNFKNRLHTILDNSVHTQICLKKIIKLLTKEAFQQRCRGRRKMETSYLIASKLCSYFPGQEIFDFREQLK
jgi:hypothetical protein